MHGPIRIRLYMLFWTSDIWRIIGVRSLKLDVKRLCKLKERYYSIWGAAVAQWLRCCATNRKVAGSISAGVIGFFIDIKYFRSHYGPGVDSASNINEYQEYFLGVKAASA